VWKEWAQGRRCWKRAEERRWWRIEERRGDEEAQTPVEMGLIDTRLNWGQIFNTVK